MSSCNKLQSWNIEMQTSKLEAKINLTHTTNKNSTFQFFFLGGKSKNGLSLWGNLAGGVLLLSLTHGGEETLEDGNVRFKHHNMALNAEESNDETP